jgi:hypothetical protein
LKSVTKVADFQFFPVRCRISSAMIGLTGPISVSLHYFVKGG